MTSRLKSPMIVGHCNILETIMIILTMRINVAHNNFQSMHGQQYLFF